MSTDHMGAIESPLFNSEGFNANCSCGWEGPRRESEALAMKDLTDHYAHRDEAPTP